MLTNEELSWIALFGVVFALSANIFIGALLGRVAKLEGRVAELEKRA